MVSSDTPDSFAYELIKTRRVLMYRVTVGDDTFMFSQYENALDCFTAYEQEGDDPVMMEYDDERFEWTLCQ